MLKLVFDVVVTVPAYPDETNIVIPLTGARLQSQEKSSPSSLHGFEELEGSSILHLPKGFL